MGAGRDPQMGLEEWTVDQVRVRGQPAAPGRRGSGGGVTTSLRLWGVAFGEWVAAWAGPRRSGRCGAPSARLL